MAERDPLAPNRALFNLGARLGSLEGYLYGEEKVEKHYLSGWMDNIAREFSSLPDGARREIAGDYALVWRKVESLVVKLYGDRDATALQIKGILNKT